MADSGESLLFPLFNAPNITSVETRHDVDDFMLFQDIELDCHELTDDEVQEGLLRVKEHVLHGASYRHEDLAPAAYELRRFFMKRKERHESLSAERERLESKVATLERVIEERDLQHSTEISILNEKHTTAIGTLEGRLGEPEARECRRVLKRKRFVSLLKKSICWLALIALEYFVGKQAITYGEGRNNVMRVASFLCYFGGAALVWLCVIKLVFFRQERLRDVFPAIAEIKELYPWT